MGRRGAGSQPLLAALAAGAALGALAALALAARAARAARRRCLLEKQEARREALQEAARRLSRLADLLRERGCYDVEPRARLEAEALARDADPEELAYYRCLIQCLRGACRIEDCMAQLGYPPRKTATHRGREKNQPPGEEP